MLNALWLGLLLAPPASPPPPLVHVEVTVAGIRPGKGTVVLKFYDKPETVFETACLTKTQRADRPALTLAADLPAGTYALAAFQDFDENGDLNLGWFHVPTEPVGFGNNFRPRWAAPTFADCAVAVSETQRKFAVVLR